MAALASSCHHRVALQGLLYPGSTCLPPCFGVPVGSNEKWVWAALHWIEGLGKGAIAVLVQVSPGLAADAMPGLPWTL